MVIYLAIAAYNWHKGLLNSNQKFFFAGYAAFVTGILIEHSRSEAVGSAIMGVGSVISLYFSIQNIWQVHRSKAQNNTVVIQQKRAQKTVPSSLVDKTANGDIVTSGTQAMAVKEQLSKPTRRTPGKSPEPDTPTDLTTGTEED